MYQIFLFTFSLNFRSPSSNTIRLWVLKIGLYELTKPKEVADDWVIILDFSIQLGQDKVLLIYGIRKSSHKFDKPLLCSDLKALKILCRPVWKKEDIKEVLEKLKTELGTILYAVSDNGSEIKRGLELAEIKQIYDLTHALAGITEKILNKDENYLAVTKEMSTMRLELCQTDAAHLIPLKQRKKSHYQNIKRVSDYLVGLSKYVKEKRFENDLKNRESQLKWIKEHSVFINNFFELNEMISKIEKILKTKYLSRNTIWECNKLMSKSTNVYVIKLKEELKRYFTKIQIDFSTEKILCTSDIIESAFGKYKNYVSQNPMAGVTGMVLCLAAFSSPLTKESIKEALESTKVEDVLEWIKKNIGLTLHQKRKLAFAFS